MSNDQNITNVRDEDKSFLRAMAELSPEKKVLFEGILIGIKLQKEPVITAAS